MNRHDVLDSSTEHHRELFSSDAQVAKYSDVVDRRFFDHERRAIEFAFTRTAGPVLDLGCGAGRTTVELTARGFDVVGIDISEEMVTRASRTEPCVPLITATATDLPFPDDSFEHVLFSYNGLDYLAPEGDRKRALEEIQRVLVPGGIFVFSSHNSWGILPTTWWNPLAYFRRVRLLWQLVRNGFRSPLYVEEEEEAGVFDVYHTSPASLKRQLAEHGLTVIEVIGRYPGRAAALVDPWPYYVAVNQPDRSAESTSGT